jgi:hypothetical protein
VYRWAHSESVRPSLPGLSLALACLTRYEAWPVTAAALALGAFARWRLGSTMRQALRETAWVAIWPGIAILGFLVLSRATVGEWFVTGGFYVIDNKAYRRPDLGVVQVWWGLRQLIGTGTLLFAVAGALGVVFIGLRDRLRSGVLVPLALAGTAALPWYAFVSGHPFRIRYMAVLAVWAALSAGLGAGLLPHRLRTLAAAALIAVGLLESPPFSSRSPLVAEAQWDRPNSLGRRRVTACLAAEFRRGDETILASMGSLAHYMQELSHAGFRLDDFLHEGIGELWPEALASPRRHVAWILFEERAEGGDLLSIARRRDPDFVAGFTRVCEGGGVALYRRDRR